MNGIHDMGGMDGMGPVDPEENEPVFHETWEGRVYGLGRSIARWGRGRDWGSFRFALESLPPADYLRMSYYERWFTVHVNRLLGSDLVTEDELESGYADASRPRPELLSPSTGGLGSGLLDVEVAARFGPDDAVRARNVHPRGTHPPAAVHARPPGHRDPRQRRLRAAGYRREWAAARGLSPARLHRPLCGAGAVGRSCIRPRLGLRRPVGGLP